MAVPAKDRFQVISEYKAGDLIYDEDYLDVKRSRTRLCFVADGAEHPERKPGQEGVHCLSGWGRELLAKVARAASGRSTCESG